MVLYFFQANLKAALLFTRCLQKDAEDKENIILKEQTQSGVLLLKDTIFAYAWHNYLWFTSVKTGKERMGKSVLREKQNKDRVYSLSAWIYRGRFQRILHNSCLDLAVNSSSFITIEVIQIYLGILVLTVKSSRLSNRNSINDAVCYKRSDLPEDRVKSNEAKYCRRQIKPRGCQRHQICFINRFIFSPPFTSSLMLNYAAVVA